MPPLRRSKRIQERRLRPKHSRPRRASPPGRRLARRKRAQPTTTEQSRTEGSTKPPCTNPVKKRRRRRVKPWPWGCRSQRKRPFRPKMPKAFTLFPQLPTELRWEIWDCALLNERKTRRINAFLVDEADFNGYRNRAWSLALLAEYNSISPYLVVNSESRGRAMRFYPDEVSAFPSFDMDETPDMGTLRCSLQNDTIAIYSDYDYTISHPSEKKLKPIRSRNGWSERWELTLPWRTARSTDTSAVVLAIAFSVNGASSPDGRPMGLVVGVTNDVYDRIYGEGCVTPILDTITPTPTFIAEPGLESMKAIFHGCSIYSAHSWNLGRLPRLSNWR
jgi:hypothetical protein